MEKSINDIGYVVTMIFIFLILHSCSSGVNEKSQEKKLDLIVEKCVKK